MPHSELYIQLKQFNKEYSIHLYIFFFGVYSDSDSELWNECGIQFATNFYKFTVIKLL